MDSKCPICHEKPALISFARIAPFITELVECGATKESALLECVDCKLSFFEYRYDEREMRLLYSGYRGGHYLSTRKKWEPWYLNSFNSVLDPGSLAVDNRVEFMTGVLNGGKINLPGLRNIVDYGGDAGQFFPRDFVGPKFLIEVSDREVAQDVRRISTLAELPESPHLVMVAHLLEHLSDPVALVSEIRRYLPSDGCIYVEVPLDCPVVRDWNTTHTYKRLLNFYVKNRWLWITADFMTGLLRNFGWRVPRLGIVKQSEHINFYSEDSLRLLLSKAGFRIVYLTVDPQARLAGLRLGRMGAIALLDE